jgi:hypothetical protein
MSEHALPLADARQAQTVWIVQIMLIIAFAVLGPMKLFMTIDALARIMTWPGEIPAWLVRLIGAAETLGALGLVLPAITGIAPWLMRWAAFGLATVMACALGYHLMLFQGMMLLPSLVLLVFAVYVGVRRM